MATQPLSESPKERAKRRRAGEDSRAGDGPSQQELIDGLADRDEAICRELIRRHHGAMVQVALGFVRSHALAEEVAQETWAAAIQGVGRFEGRSSLKTWLFGILIKRAKAAGSKEQRSRAVSQLDIVAKSSEGDPTEAFFHSEKHPDAGGWAIPPKRWKRTPEKDVLNRELGEWIVQGIATLPEGQGVVVVLRDAEGWATCEIAELLGRSRNWVRVNLHRGRFKLRAFLAEKLEA